VNSRSSAVLAGMLFLFAVVLFLLSGRLIRWMHGAEAIKA
jgi:hypothetical protein